MGLILEGAALGGTVGCVCGAWLGTFAESDELFVEGAVLRSYTLSGAKTGAKAGALCGTVLEVDQIMFDDQDYKLSRTDL